MDTQPRRRAAVFAAPMLIGLLGAQRAAVHLRTVDFLLVFFGGAAFGCGLVGLIRTLRRPQDSRV